MRIKRTDDRMVIHATCSPKRLEHFLGESHPQRPRTSAACFKRCEKPTPQYYSAILLRLALACIDIGIRSDERCVSAKTINAATNKFSEKRADELASLYANTYPGLGIVIDQFKARRKGFDISILLEVGAKVTDLAQSNSELPELTWASCGFEDLISLDRSLLRTNCLLYKEGRSDQARVPDDGAIKSLAEKTGSQSTLCTTLVSDLMVANTSRIPPHNNVMHTNRVLHVF